MKQKMLAIFLLISLTVIGQTQVRLKNGESVQGNIRSLENGVLTMTVNSKVLTFEQSDISVIYFEKLPDSGSYSLAIYKTPLGADNPSLGSKGMIKGRVLNDNENKPDVGAHIYLRKVDTSNGQRTMTSRYELARMCKQLIGNSNDEEFKSWQDLLKKLDADTQEGFDKLDKATFSDLRDLDHDKNVVKVTADASGHYSIKASPGFYELIAVSKSITGKTISESKGQFYSILMTLSAGKEFQVDTHFGL